MGIDSHQVVETHIMYHDCVFLVKSDEGAVAYCLKMKMWNEPPDAYGAIAYMASDILFQSVEKAGSFETGKISNVLSTSKFQTIKGEVYFREDHQMVSKYLAFLVKGKSPAAKKGKWDVFEVVGYFGGDQALPSLKSLGY